jgi:nucleotide-binding universal stress UspA family protein
MKLLIAIDLSEASNKVMAAAQQFARPVAAETWLIHVAEADPDFVGYEPGPQTVRDQVAHKFRGEQKKLHEYAEALRAAGIKVTPLVIQGPTSETILNEGKKLGVDLIVIGSHGHGALRQMLVGSVSEGVIRGAVCPVLVVPTHHSS